MLSMAYPETVIFFTWPPERGKTGGHFFAKAALYTKPLGQFWQGRENPRPEILAGKAALRQQNCLPFPLHL